MRVSTILNMFASWFLCCIANSIGKVHAKTTMNRHSSLLGVQSSLQNGDKNVLFASSKASSNLSFLRTTTALALLNTRGGADDEEESSDEYDEYDEESEFDEDEDDFLEGFDEGSNEDDFKQDNQMDHLIEEYHRTPPITKAYLTAAFGASTLGYITNKNEFPKILALDWNKVFKSGQIWRPFTAFLNLGSLSIVGYPLSIHFVHQYMSHLERLKHDKPYDFWIMLVFGMTMMTVGYAGFKQDPRLLGHNLSTFFVYIWSRMFEGTDVLFFYVRVKAELLPWVIMAQTYFLEGEAPLLDFLGIVFGHVFYHFRKVGLLSAPEWLINWYNESPQAAVLREKYKTISVEFGV